MLPVDVYPPDYPPLVYPPPSFPMDAHITADNYVKQEPKDFGYETKGRQYESTKLKVGSMKIRN